MGGEPGAVNAETLHPPVEAAGKGVLSKAGLKFAAAGVGPLANGLLDVAGAAILFGVMGLGIRTMVRGGNSKS